MNLRKLRDAKLHFQIKRIPNEALTSQTVPGSSRVIPYHKDSHPANGLSLDKNYHIGQRELGIRPISN